MATELTTETVDEIDTERVRGLRSDAASASAATATGRTQVIFTLRTRAPSHCRSRHSDVYRRIVPRPIAPSEGILDPLARRTPGSPLLVEKLWMPRCNPVEAVGGKNLYAQIAHSTARKQMPASRSGSPSRSPSLDSRALASYIQRAPHPTTRTSRLAIDGAFAGCSGGRPISIPAAAFGAALAASQNAAKAFRQSEGTPRRSGSLKERRHGVPQNGRTYGDVCSSLRRDYRRACVHIEVPP